MFSSVVKGRMEEVRSRLGFPPRVEVCRNCVGFKMGIDRVDVGYIPGLSRIAWGENDEGCVRVRHSRARLMLPRIEGRR